MSIVVGLLSVAVAVAFDWRHEFGAGEIDSMLIQRLLMGKLEAGEPFVL